MGLLLGDGLLDVTGHDGHGMPVSGGLAIPMRVGPARDMRNAPHASHEGPTSPVQTGHGSACGCLSATCKKVNETFTLSINELNVTPPKKTGG
jgi:hypothetical protein